MRSHESILAEAEKIVWEPDFKGYIHDVGPTANFRAPACDKQMTKGVCPNKQCLFPTPCKNLKVDHKDYLKLLRKLRELPNVKKVFIRSGIRFDYLIYDEDRTFLRELCEHHVSGQLKVAPEHISDAVLEKMGKPARGVYKRFVKAYQDMNEKLGKKQISGAVSDVIPSGIDVEGGGTRRILKRSRLYMEQVQDFIESPSTISTCMYYTGLDPHDAAGLCGGKPHEKSHAARAHPVPEPEELRSCCGRRWQRGGRI